MRCGSLWPDPEVPTAGRAGPLTEVDLLCDEVSGTAHFDPHWTSSDLLLTPKPFCAYPRIESEKR